MQNTNKLYVSHNPDRNPNPNQSGHPSPAALAFTGQFSPALHQQHRSLELSQVLVLVRQHVPRQWWNAEVVGSWVWVHQSRTLSDAERSALFELGFHWNPRRQAWQHPCGVLRPVAAGVGPLPRYLPAFQERPVAAA